MRRAIRYFVFFLIVGALAFLLSKFFQENSELVQVSLMGWRTKPMSTGLFVTFTFFLGISLSFVLTITALISKSIETTRLRRENTALQRMLEEKTKTHSSSSKI